MPRSRRPRPTFTGSSSARQDLLSGMDAHSDSDASIDHPLSASQPVPSSYLQQRMQHSPQNFVERWMQRTSAADRNSDRITQGRNTEGPSRRRDSSGNLRRRRSNSSTAHRRRRSSTALLDDMDNDFGIGIPMDSGIFGDEHILGGGAASDTDSLKSKPSTRRSSMDSSIDDVCMPLDDEEGTLNTSKGSWPDTAVLDEFAARERAEQESAEAAELVRESVDEAADAAKSGRLRPRHLAPWERPNVLHAQSTMRFSYFRDDLPATVHSPTIGGLLQPGQQFAELFPSTISCEAASASALNSVNSATTAANTAANAATTAASAASTAANVAASTTNATDSPANDSGPPSAAPQPMFLPGTSPAPSLTPSVSASVAPSIPSTPTSEIPWWLDINSPTEEEMRVISRAFGIHPLTVEDVILHETREKVELFHNYYFVCFTSFDVKAWESKPSDDSDNAGAAATSGSANQPENPSSSLANRRGSVSGRSHNSSHKRPRRRIERLKPLAVFSIVFKTGIITVHYRPTPHTINVRRRIRLLRDYLNVSSDWISYALIDDITDGYGPLITAVDEDVQSIEDAILLMHGSHSDEEEDDDVRPKSVISSLSGSSSTGYREWREKGDMLRWIGESRKRVMSLLSLLSNKADVIKGFSKRVSDHWSGASRSEIAMYLSDIQDHLVTMTQSLNHYEKLLARSHSNYLAQLNIDMTRTNNEMNDVLSKISVLGTIVLPMNIVTGLWGMNVLVPGQESGTLSWFWGIVVMMFLFAVSAYFVIMRFV